MLDGTLIGHLLREQVMVLYWECLAYEVTTVFLLFTLVLGHGSTDGDVQDSVSMYTYIDIESFTQRARIIAVEMYAGRLNKCHVNQNTVI